MADATYSAGFYREQGGNRGVVASSGSLDVESGGEIDVESGGAFKVAGTDIIASIDALGDVALSTGELAYLDAVTAGTAANSKAVVAGAAKQVDILAITDLSIGVSTAAAYNVTATAKELNLTDNQVASVGYTLSNATSYVKNVDIQTYDAAGSAMAGVQFVRLVLFGSSAGNALLSPTSAQTFSTGTNAATCDLIVQTTAHPEISFGVTSTSGLISVKLSDTGETATWLAVVLPNGNISLTSVAITTTSS